MESIIYFKKSILNNTLKNFLKMFLGKSKDEQLLFIKELKKTNLDIFFYQKIKEYSLVDKFNIEIVELLKKDYFFEKGLDNFYKNEFFKIITEAKFPILLMKGWQLRNTINHDLYKRSCDVDIMVLGKDYSRTVKMLENKFNFFQNSEYIYGQNSLSNKNTMCIDLHTKLVAYQSLNSIFNLDSEELFKETILIKDEHIEYRVFKNEMTFIHLCIHFLLHHKGTGFILLYELKTFLEFHLLDLNRVSVILIAKKFNCIPLLVYCLMIINKLCILIDLERKWIDDFIDEFDYDKNILNLFQTSFIKDDFLKDIELPHEVIKKLIINDTKNRISFINGSLKYYIDYLINSFSHKIK